MHRIAVDADIEMISLRLKSAEEIFRNVEESRSFLEEWLPWVPETQGIEDVQRYIRQVNDKKCPKHDESFEIRFNEEFAGIVTLKEIDTFNRKAEIGYWLTKRYAGKGIMMRSCKALIQYAFEDLGLNKVFIRCSVENVRSCNIPKQLQFTFEGIEREGEFLNRKFVDLKIYSMLKKEWLKIHVNNRKH
ncbi:MAG: GNAT family N-acetyltransferase [Bacteroidetes bacterium]|nr:GNAT family N-acetyltransferase [Bacteroidota bacterium]